MQNKNLSLTNIIIAITVLMYIIQININYGSLVLGLNRYMVIEGFWWQPLSTMFAHGGIGHLGMNMFVLYQFGNAVERYKGKTVLFIAYFVFGLLTSLVSFLLYTIFRQSCKFSWSFWCYLCTFRICCSCGYLSKKRYCYLDFTYLCCTTTNRTSNCLVFSLNRTCNRLYRWTFIKKV